MNSKKIKLSIGLMSGTSMDGIDAALIETDGQAHIKELSHLSYAYAPEFKILLKAAELGVRQQAGDLITAKRDFPLTLEKYLTQELNYPPTDLPLQLAQLTRYLQATPSLDEVIKHSTHLHSEIVKVLLQKTQYKASTIDVIGYHGQTLFHQPSAKITLQIGDGNLLAKETGITVINDFRARDVAAGGQGAPFAPIYHQALAVRDQKIPAVVVNCGGIANVTVIAGETIADVSGFDTGPGNALIDRYIKQRTSGKEHMDTDGLYGRQGKVNEAVLKVLYQKSIAPHKGDFFAAKPPKSLDVGDLILPSELASLSLEDACATLEAFTADTIVASTNFFTTEVPSYWILAGGGWHNPIIREQLEIRLRKKLGPEIKIITADEIGWSNNALEAQLFAYLAVRSLLGLPISLPTVTQVAVPLTGGEIHLPP